MTFFQDSLDFCLIILYSTPFHKEYDTTHKSIHNTTNKIQIQNQDQGKSRSEQRKLKHIKPRNLSQQLSHLSLSFRKAKAKEKAQ